MARFDGSEDILEQARALLKRSRELVAVANRPLELERQRVRGNKRPVSVQPRTANRKLAPQRFVDVNGRIRNEPKGPYCASTYVSIDATCPSSCPFRGNGCYAQAGMAVARLDRIARAGEWSSTMTIEAEVEAIDLIGIHGVPQDGARGGRDLRLHVSGDVGDERGARMLAAAADRWRARGGGDVWTFTHLWRDIPRSAWGSISVLASVETPAQVAEALGRAYAPAMTVKSHDGSQAYEVNGAKIVPCPAQTRGRTCIECRLCLRARPGSTIGVSFAVHGIDADDAKAALETTGEP